MTAKIGRNKITGEPASPRLRGGEASASPQPTDGSELPALARRAVETFLLERRVVALTPAVPSSLLAQRLPCFVCIKTIGRELRGCIGMVEPEKDTLAEEIITNAISAAIRDPRFRPVSSAELPFLRYSVDVLDRPEPARLEDLNPATFGVIVMDHLGLRRGLLLPDIEGVKTAGQQVHIAARKAGIAPHESFKLFRFHSHRFKEMA
jgi:AmmeMemoRadiSam system protein A